MLTEEALGPPWVHSGLEVGWEGVTTGHLMSASQHCTGTNKTGHRARPSNHRHKTPRILPRFSFLLHDESPAGDVTAVTWPSALFQALPSSVSPAQPVTRL
ncbi:hypothetical protein SKAU_G00103750 [Synaphobranchus kaupii]|uniref:Uncharacterized protein n=1 Tax=Synaphobranchus kaupii TaxID=118154 RepID=A0A9Q1FZA5_SYNKA|nr:hypothetical protein SKAU_G00103750 [Synaphobranchus kaupii]